MCTFVLTQNNHAGGGQLQDEDGIESGMSRRCHLLTNLAPSNHRSFIHQSTPQSTSGSTHPTCSPPKNISIVITRSPLPFLYTTPPPPFPLPPTHHTHSANLRLVSTNRCLPQRLPSTKTFRPLVTPSTRIQSDPGFSHGHKDTQGKERQSWSEQRVLLKVPTSCDQAEGVHTNAWARLNLIFQDVPSRFQVRVRRVQSARIAESGAFRWHIKVYDAMTVMIGHMKMRMNIPVRMNTFILMCSCLCLTFTGKDILCNASFVWMIGLFLKIYLIKLT